MPDQYKMQSTLPADVVRYIFGMVGCVSLGRLCRVSKWAREIALSTHIGRYLYSGAPIKFVDLGWIGPDECNHGLAGHNKYTNPDGKPNPICKLCKGQPTGRIGEFVYPVGPEPILNTDCIIYRDFMHITAGPYEVYNGVFVVATPSNEGTRLLFHPDYCVTPVRCGDLTASIGCGDTITTYKSQLGSITASIGSNDKVTASIGSRDVVSNGSRAAALILFLDLARTFPEVSPVFKVVFGADCGTAFEKLTHDIINSAVCLTHYLEAAPYFDWVTIRDGHYRLDYDDGMINISAGRYEHKSKKLIGHPNIETLILGMRRKYAQQFIARPNQ